MTQVKLFSREDFDTKKHFEAAVNEFLKSVKSFSSLGALPDGTIVVAYAESQGD